MFKKSETLIIRKESENPNHVVVHDAYLLDFLEIDLNTKTLTIHCRQQLYEFDINILDSIFDEFDVIFRKIVVKEYDNKERLLKVATFKIMTCHPDYCYKVLDIDSEHYICVALEEYEYTDHTRVSYEDTSLYKYKRIAEYDSEGKFNREIIEAYDKNTNELHHERIIASYIYHESKLLLGGDMHIFKYDGEFGNPDSKIVEFIELDENGNWLIHFNPNSNYRDEYTYEHMDLDKECVKVLKRKRTVNVCNSYDFTEINYINIPFIYKECLYE